MAGPEEEDEELSLSKAYRWYISTIYYYLATHIT
jgi:hypothetical protein